VTAMPRVSVIIASYNSAHFLPACVASLQRQTWQDFEVLIVDDGSTDNTREVVADLRNDSRVCCVHQERRGLPGARNAGARASQGEYLVFLDADDFLADEALALLVARFDASGAAWANVGYLRLEGSLRIPRLAIDPPGNLLLAILDDDYIARCPCVRRADFFEIGMYDEAMQMREDWDINIRLIAAGKPHICIPEPLYHYSRTEGSITTGSRLRVLRYTDQLLRKHHKARADAGDSAVARIYARNQWVQARLYWYEFHSVRDTLRCVLESLRYDFRWRRLIQPLLSRIAQARGRV
jgi:glycosyltransferase involved in cell wall biosynthesis